MTPYYEDSSSGITIYHGDCRDVLPSIPLQSVAAVISDPPYGISLTNNDRDGHRRDEAYELAGDADQSVGKFVVEWAGVKPLILFASPWKPWPGDWRNLIVWDKGGAVGGGGDIKTTLKRSWELIQVARNGEMCGSRSESVWYYPITPQDTALHICAKPVDLMAALICRFSPAIGSIVDPCCGAGATLVAAKQCARQAIGVEINERYCEIAAKRLAQGVLFGLEVPA